MRQALQYLSGIRRSVTRSVTGLLPRPPLVRPQLGQPPLLRALMAGRPHCSGVSDAALAVEFFRARPAAAGFLTAAEAREAAAGYGSRKPAWRQALLDEAERLCTEGLPVYAMLAPPLGGGLDWAALPVDAHGDRLCRLRPHRFGFLPRLALAACLGSDCLPALRATLARWIDRVEAPGGAEDAYFSNLVVTYRLVAVSWAAPLLAAKAADGDETAAEICLLLFRILAADCRHLPPLLGQSVPNNHRLADRFVAWLLAACYPELTAPAAPLAKLEQDWHAELGRQFQEDGTNFEQSLHYHELGCEMALAYLVIALRQGIPPRGEALTLIGRMLRFQAALADRHGSGFALGDSTDDPLLPLDGGGGWARGAWRMLYRALFDPDFPATGETAAGAERAFWLLAGLRDVERPLRLAAAPEPLGQLAAFPLGGYVAFREEDSDDCLLFRSGPARETAVTAGHAMADLLSVYWRTAGQAVLEPAGTYSYAAAGSPAGGGPSAPRDYFRSPAAHNGPVLRGHDPLGAPGGRFRSADSGARAATRWQALEGVAGWAEARLEEAGPLNGWRRGVLRIPGRHSLVYDRLPPLAPDADLACHWQFAPEAVLALRSARQVAATLGGLSTHLCASEGVAAIDCVKGRSSPAAGWLSRRYGQLEAAPQLICRLQPGARAVAFALGRGDRLPEVAVALAGDDGLAVVLQDGASCAVAVFGNFSGELSGSGALGGVAVDFAGDALWLAFAGGRCSEIRALGLQRFAAESLGIALSAAEPLAMPAGWRRLAADASGGGLSGRWAAAPHGRGDGQQ